MYRSKIIFSLKKVITGVPKGSIDGQLLYNLHNLFFFLRFSTLNNYAGGKNLFSTGTGIRPIYKMLLFDFRTVNNKSCENLMILNPGNCHFMSTVADSGKGVLP